MRIAYRKHALMVMVLDTFFFSDDGHKLPITSLHATEFSIYAVPGIETRQHSPFTGNWNLIGNLENYIKVHNNLSSRQTDHFINRLLHYHHGMECSAKPRQFLVGTIAL